MKPETLKGFAYVMLSILIWSGWMVVSRYAVKSTLSPYDVTAIRFTTAGILMLPVVVKKGLRIGPWGLGSALVLSMLIGAPYTNIAVAGMLFAPASHASTVINGTLLVLVTVVGIHGLRESTSWLRIAGVACSVAGIVCMLFAKNVYGGPYQWLGHLLFVVAGAMWGGYTLLVRHWKVDALHAAAVVVVFSMLCYTPIYLMFIPHHIGLNNWHEVVFQTFYQGIMTGVVALIAFNLGIHKLGATRTGALIPLVPVISTLLAIPVLDEVPTGFEWFGVAAVSFGVFLGSGALSWRPSAKADCLLLQAEESSH